MMIGIVNVQISVPSVDIQQLKHINTQVKFRHLVGLMIGPCSPNCVLCLFCCYCCAEKVLKIV